jgi:hypothetical protein
MKSELELPRFWFVLLALLLLASMAVPPSANAQVGAQTQPAAAPASAQTPPNCTTPPATSTSTDKGVETAASTVSKAANSISNLGSIFGKKKTAQNAGQVANVAGGCDAKVNAATADAGTVVAAAKTAGSAANSSSAGPAAAPATTPNSSVATQPANSPVAPEPQGNSALYVPPSGAPAAFVGPLDSSKLPDISGLHLGMTLAEAKAVLQKLYPGTTITAMGGTPIGPQHQVFTGLYRGAGDSTGSNEAGVDFTAPPNPQIVWHMARITPQPHVAHNVLVAALRQKYGKEAYATGPAQAMTTNDSAIQQMYWVFDEQGQPVTGVKIIGGSPYGCDGTFPHGTAGPGGYYTSLMTKDTGGLSTYCASSYVSVLATMSNQPIVDNLVLDIVDLALVVRSAKATDALSKAEFDKARQQDIQNSEQVKPTL